MLSLSLSLSLSKERTILFNPLDDKIKQDPNEIHTSIDYTVFILHSKETRSRKSNDPQLVTFARDVLKIYNLYTKSRNKFFSKRSESLKKFFRPRVRKELF